MSAPAISETTNCVSKGPGVIIERITGIAALDDLRDAWDELLAASDFDCVFLTWEMFRAWWDSYGKGHELLVLRCTDSAGNLVAIVPMVRGLSSMGGWLSAREIRLVGHVRGGAEKLDWIVRKGFEEDVVPAILDWIDREAPKWDIFLYNAVRHESPVARVLLAECSRRKWYILHHEKLSYFVPIPADWQSFLASRSKKMRTIIPQRVRRAERTFKLRARRCDSLDNLQADLNVLYKLHAKRWQTRGQSGNLFQPEKQKFYFELASRFLERGWLEFWLLEFNDRPVACEFGFSYGGIYSNLQQGFDPEFASFGAGAVLRAAIIQDLIRRGLHGYDFLLGDEPYKERWGGQPNPLLFVTLARPHSFGEAVLKMHEFAGSVKAGIRARTPQSFINFFRRLRGLNPDPPSEPEAAPKLPVKPVQNSAPSGPDR